MAPRRVFVVGVGMTAFEKPRGRVDYPELGLEATVKALLDAGVNYDDVQQAYVGYCYADTTAGQRVLYQLGMTGIPITNVNNACSTGSTAIFLARQAVQYGVAECALALGFEVMAPGSLSSAFPNSTSPMDKTYNILQETRGGKGPPASLIFGNGGQEYCEKYGASMRHIAQIAAKNHTHSVNNPYSQFREGRSADDVLNDKQISNILTRGMCCPTSDGAAAVVVVSEDFVHKHGLENQAIEILHQAVATDDPDLFESKNAIELTGANMTRRAAKEAFKATGLTPNDLSIIELHDCFAPNELLVYEGLGLCKKGEAHKIVERGDNTYGGKWVINPSGGLLAKGHPLGATGIGMYFYLVTQLRGISGPMQVKKVAPGNSKGPVHALAHNLGLGGSCSVSILARPDFYKTSGKDGRSRVGYEFGYTCKKICKDCIEKVRSRKAYSSFAAKHEPKAQRAPNNTTAVSKL